MEVELTNLQVITNTSICLLRLPFPPAFGKTLGEPRESYVEKT
jgi:hypothetical protein